MTGKNRAFTIEKKRKKKGMNDMASSVIGKLDSQVDKIFFQKGLSRSVDEEDRLKTRSEEEREAYLAEKKARDEDIVLY